MKRFFCLVVLLALLCPVNFALADNGDTVVYVTKSGECYHRGHCSYLKSQKPMKLADAAQYYRPCSLCDPPILGIDRATDNDPYQRKSEPFSNSSTASRSTAAVSSGSSAAAPVTPVVPAGRSAPSDSEKFTFTISASTFFLIIFLGPILLPLVILAPGIVVQRRKDAVLRVEYEQKYGGMNRLQIARACGMPSDLTIFPDDCPHSVSYGPDCCTVYVSRSGACYHSRPHCGGVNLQPVNASQLRPGMRPCSRCGKPLPDMSWYDDYQKVLSETKRLDLPVPPSLP